MSRTDLLTPDRHPGKRLLSKGAIAMELGWQGEPDAFLLASVYFRAALEWVTREDDYDLWLLAHQGINQAKDCLGPNA